MATMSNIIHLVWIVALSCIFQIYGCRHGLRTPREEIVFIARPKIHSHSQIFRYGQSIFCLSDQGSILIWITLLWTILKPRSSSIFFFEGVQTNKQKSFFISYLETTINTLVNSISIPFQLYSACLEPLSISNHSQ